MTTDYVMIHGGGRGGWCWEPTIEAMQAKGHPNLGRVAALDMPGWGKKKEVTEAGCTVEGYVASAIRDIEASGLCNIVLVGHSFAGLVMPYVVTRIPERIQRTIFMACAVPPEGQSLRDLLVEMGKVPANMRNAPMGPNAHARRFPVEWDAERSGRRLGRERAQWLLDNLRREFQKQFPTPAMDRVSRTGFHGLRPVTWVLLTRDRSMPPRWQRRFAREVGGEQCEIVEVEAQHDAMISRPKEVAEALLRYAT